ncbi:PepSY-associated TM helix domain-containing protein [candidate division KSB1 bacterium]|nr:PepSY-associated TM helix domain-containing protein [candidate division KSB1 bacterium]
MDFNWRKWNRIFHRDLGYLFFGMTVIYAISGIALNHQKDWNPNYVVSYEQIKWDSPLPQQDIQLESVLGLLEKYGEKDNYKKYYFPDSERLKIFIKSGSVEINLNTGEGFIEKLKRRPLLFEMNFLHYNPGKLWMYFSDIFAIGLIIVSVTGLLILKGKHGITRRGGWLTTIGILLPIIFLLAYL